MSRQERKNEEKASSEQPPSQPNPNALFQVPRLEEMILSTLGMKKLNELITCDATSPLWTQFKLTPDLQENLWRTYAPQLICRLGELIVKEANLNQAEAMIKVNPALLLGISEVETHAADLAGTHVWVRGAPLQLALAAEDDEMALMIAGYLDEHYPGAKQTQYQAQFPNEAKEEKAEDFWHTADGLALKTIFDAISQASIPACEQVHNHEEKIDESVAGVSKLLAALNAFRDYLAPKKDPQGKVIPITTGKHFNMQLLIEAFKLYDQNYTAFGGLGSPKSRLCLWKLIGFMERFLPACYAQAFAQGIYYIVEEGKQLRRSFDFRFGGGSYFPLDSDPNFRLGYNYVVAPVWRLLGGAGWGPRVAWRLENYVKQKQQHCTELCNSLAISLKASV